MALKALLKSWWKVNVKEIQLFFKDLKRNCYSGMDLNRLVNILACQSLYNNNFTLHVESVQHVLNNLVYIYRSVCCKTKFDCIDDYKVH